MNGNWLATGSRDFLVKLFDIRTMKEFGTLHGHNKEVLIEINISNLLILKLDFRFALLHGTLIMKHVYLREDLMDL